MSEPKDLEQPCKGGFDKCTGQVEKESGELDRDGNKKKVKVTCGQPLDALSFKEHQSDPSKPTPWLACNTKGCENYQETKNKSNLDEEMFNADKIIKKVEIFADVLINQLNEELEISKQLCDKVNKDKYTFEHLKREFLRNLIEYLTNQLKKLDFESLAPTANGFIVEVEKHLEDSKKLMDEMVDVKDQIVELRAFLSTNRSIHVKSVVEDTNKLLALSTRKFDWGDRIEEIKQTNIKLVEDEKKNRETIVLEYQKPLYKKLEELKAKISNALLPKSDQMSEQQPTGKPASKKAAIAS